MVTLLIATYPNSQAVGDKCSLLGKHRMGEKAEFPNILSTVSGKMLGSLILWKQFERFCSTIFAEQVTVWLLKPGPPGH